MGEVTVVVADDDVGLAGHARMCRHLPERQAERGVVGVGGERADLVAGVEILDVGSDASSAQSGDESIAEPGPDIGEPQVAGSIGTLDAGEEFLAGAFGDDHNGVVATAESLEEDIDEAAVPVEREGHLWDEA